MKKTLHSHNIVFHDNEYEEIKEYCKKIGVTVSQFIRELAIGKIKNEEDMKLLEFINKNLGFVSEEEQQDIEKFMENYNKNNEEFVEVSLDDLL